MQLPSMLGAGGATPMEIVVLLLALAALIGLARLLGELSRLLKQPAILGEILAGVLLGPTVLGSVSPQMYAWLFPTEGFVSYALHALFILSAIMLLLIAGLEVELSSVWRQGKAALSVAVMSMIAPFVVGFGIAWLAPTTIGFDPATQAGNELPFALFIGVALSITALPVIAKILMDMHLSKSELGTVVISAAMLNDLVGWIGFAMVLAMISTGSEVHAADTASPGIGATIGLTLLFIGGMLTVGNWLFNRLIPLIQAHGSWPGGMLSFVIVAALLGAAYTEYIGIHSIFGAFIVGIALGNSRHMREQVRHTIHDFIANIFAPLFFASIGLRVSFVESFDLTLVLVVLVVAIVGKLIGGYYGAVWAGMGKRESGAVGFAMCARGAMEIILAQLALSAGLISDRLFVAIVIMALVTSLISGPAIEKLLARKKAPKLRDFLSDRGFISKMRATNVREAIRELSARAAAVTGIDYETIDGSVWRREQIVSTGMGDELAVPHARLDELDEPQLIIGRSPTGIDFNSAAGDEAQIICLLLTPSEGHESHLMMFDLIARAFHDAGVRQQVMQAGSYTELLAVFNIEQG